MAIKIVGDFTITIRKKANSYTVEAKGSKNFKGINIKPKTSPQLASILFNKQYQATLKALANEKGNVTPDEIQKLGEALYNALFIPPILLAFGKARGSLKGNNGLRLRLRIEPPELAVLPWETLYDKQDWLSTRSNIPLVRELILEPGSKTLQNPQVQRPLKIIFVGASPEDLPNLEIEETATELEKLLEESIKKKEIKFEKILNATLYEVKLELLKDYHILYFAGHGNPEEIFLDDGQGEGLNNKIPIIWLLLREYNCIAGILFLRDCIIRRRRKGDNSSIPPKILAQALEGKPTRLVFLAACNTSAAPDESGLLSGFAQQLAQRSKLPAIVAMQSFISNKQAKSLTTQFLGALANRVPIDVALAEARKILIGKGQVGRDVFSPVLYLQAEDGVLFPKAKDWQVIVRNLVIGILLVATSWLGLRIFSTYRINRITTSSEELFASNNQLEALLESIRAGKHANNRFFIWIDADTRLQAGLKLQNMMNRVKEYNRWEGQKVLDISFNPKDGLMAWAGEDNTIKLGQPDGTIRILEGHTGSVISVSFNPDGQMLASVSKDNTVKLWKRDGNLVRTLEGHNSWVRDVAFSPDGELIASASEDGTIKLWKSDDGKLLRTLKGHSSTVNSISFSPNGELIASASLDKTVKIWRLDGTLVRTIEGHNDGVMDVTFSPDGQRIATASDDNTIKLWKLDGTLVYIIEEAHSTVVLGITFSPDGQLVASVGDDGMVKLWTSDGGYLLRELPKASASRAYGGGISFSPDGQLIASPGQNDTVRLWKLEEGLKILKSNHGFVNSVSFSPNGQLIASGHDDNTVKLWKSDGTMLRTLEGHSSGVNSISFSRNSQLIASTSWDNTIKIWDIKGKLIRTIDGSVRIQNGEVIHDVINSVSFSPVDGQLIASGHGDNTVKLWKSDGTLIRILEKPNQLSRFNFQVKLIRVIQPMVIEGHNDGVRDVGFSPDGELIASATQDNKIRLWKIDGYLESTLPGHNQTLWSLSFSPDGKLIASASSDNTIKIWKLKDSSLIHTLQGHQDEVRDVSFSPDGKLIASASNDNTVKLWKLNDGSLIDTFEGHDREVKSISFKPDGNILASASYDGKVVLWSLALDQPLERSCNWVKDYLKNPSVSESYKHLCDDISMQIGTQK